MEDQALSPEHSRLLHPQQCLCYISAYQADLLRQMAAAEDQPELGSV